MIAVNTTIYIAAQRWVMSKFPSANPRAMCTPGVSGIAQAIGCTQFGRIEIGKNAPEKK